VLELTTGKINGEFKKETYTVSAAVLAANTT